MTLRDLVNFSLNNWPLVLTGLASPVVIYGIFKYNLDLVRDMGKEIEDLYNKYLN